MEKNISLHEELENMDEVLAEKITPTEDEVLSPEELELLLKDVDVSRSTHGTLSENEVEVYTYHYDEYIKDMLTLYNLLMPIKNDIHLVAIFKGSLPIVTHLSNMLNVPMSIIYHQTRDDHASTRISWYGDMPPLDKTIVVIDDIYDTGKTIRNIKQFLSFPKTDRKIEYFTLFSNGPTDQVTALNNSEGRWVVFPWEKL